MKERLQKIISRAGICSRRKAEELITQGRVKVNGHTVTKLGTEADSLCDVIEVNGKIIRKEKNKYFLFNKPDKVITSMSDPAGRRIVSDYFKEIKERVFPVGRLDYHSEGLLLMTNDGDFDYMLTHPSNEVYKIYEVTVRGKFSKRIAEKMEKGVKIDSGITAPCEIEIVSYNEEKNKTVLKMVLHEGKNREIRKMMEAFHYPVFKLERIGYSFLTLKGVKRGEFRALKAEEVRRLYELHK